jgi:hypothetical protein
MMRLSKVFGRFLDRLLGRLFPEGRLWISHQSSRYVWVQQLLQSEYLNSSLFERALPNMHCLVPS